MTTLTDHQWSAVKKVVNWFKTDGANGDPLDYGDAPVCYLGGYAGTGKSTILPYIIEKCGLHPSEVVFCAPTGKAARIMGQKLYDVYNDPKIAPTTIHRLMYKPRPEKVDALKRKILELSILLSHNAGVKTINVGGDDVERYHLEESLELMKRELDRLYTSKDGPRFQINTDSIIREARLVVVDEASMVGETMADDMREFGIPILAIGDPGQLPPIREHPGLTIGTPDVFLEEIHRQAADNPIIWLANQVRQGNTNINYGTIGHNVRILRQNEDTVSADPDRNAMVLCGSNLRRYNLTCDIREASGFTDTGPMEGEPLIVTKNCRKDQTLVNGTFALTTRDVGNLKEGSSSFRLEMKDEMGQHRSLHVAQCLFERHYAKNQQYSSCSKEAMFDSVRKLDNVDWGWVVTVHKAQGSSWKDVVLHDQSSVFKNSQKQWLYTGITRASETLTIVR